MHDYEDLREVSLAVALIPVVVLVACLALSVYLFGADSSYGPNQIALLLAAGVAQWIGRHLGWSKLQEAMRDGIGLATGACLVLLMVGLLIGTWMLSGTAPALIYYGLAILEPSYFYPVCCLVCAAVAVTIGSSWTTAATVGVALMAVAEVLGMSLPVTAGAVISGAYFGDKMSPLSDTTNLAPGVVGVDLFDHIRHMVWTTAPSFLVALLLFTALGAGAGQETLAESAVQRARSTLETEFRIGLVPLLPLLLLLVLAVRRVPAYPALALSGAAGVAVSVAYQHEVAVAFADPAGELAPPVAAIKAVWLAMATGYQGATGDPLLDDLLSRGGMSSMLNTLWLIICAMVFGSSMERTGLLGRIVESLLAFVRGTGSLVATTVLTCIGMNVLTADQYMAIVLPGRMYRLEFARRGLAPVNLSRTVEDAGTLTSVLVPWNTCGAFMAATLGVATFAYLPFAFFNLINPLVAVAYGFAGIRLVRSGEQSRGGGRGASA